MDSFDDDPLLVEGFIDGVDFMVFYDRLPSRSWWMKFPFESRGVDFRQDPTAMPGWEDFRPFLPEVRYLSVTQILNKHAVDLGFLSEAVRVVMLAVPPARTEVDVSHLFIRWFSGNGKGLKGLFDLPTLKTLVLEEGGLDRQIHSPVEELRMMHLRRVTGLPQLDKTLLSKLIIWASKAVDLNALSGCSRLSSLTLSCDQLLGTSALADLTALTELTLIDCPEIENVAALLALQAVSVHVGGSNPFDASFRQQVQSTSSADWSFPQVMPTAAGKKLYLIHPGLSGPLLATGGDDEGPGERVTRRWESATQAEQRTAMANFAAKTRDWLLTEHVAVVREVGRGTVSAFEDFEWEQLQDEDGYFELGFETESGIEIARITENLWNGLVIQSQHKPSVKTFR